MEEGIKTYFKVEEGRIFIPHCDGELAFHIQPEGPGAYHEVAKKLAKRGLRKPTGGEAASFIYAAEVAAREKNPEDIEGKLAREIISRIEGHPFWFYTLICERPQGTWFIDNSEWAEEKDIRNLRDKEIPYPVILNKNGTITIYEKNFGINFKNPEVDDLKVFYNPKRTIRYAAMEEVGNVPSEKLSRYRRVRSTAGIEGSKKLEALAKMRHGYAFIGGSNNPQGKNLKLPAYYFSSKDHGLVIAEDDYNSERNDGFCYGIDPEKSTSLQEIIELHRTPDIGISAQK